MKQIAVVSLVVLWGSLLSIAQSVAQSPMSSGFGIAGMEGLGQSGAPGQTPGAAGFAIKTPANICPANMRARYLAGGDTVKVDRTAHAQGTGPRLRLSLASRDARKITAATIEVHGLTSKVRKMPVQSGMEPASDASQTIQLQLAQAAGNEATAIFRAKGMVVIQTIDLESVTYADGSILRLRDERTCSVAPYHLILVSSHAVAGR